MVSYVRRPSFSRLGRRFIASQAAAAATASTGGPRVPPIWVSTEFLSTLVPYGGQAAATATASDGNAQRPAEAAVDVDPRLLMAARCGHSERLKSLLLLLNKDVDVEAGRASLLPPVTMEGDTVLHVVAACCDDAQKFRDCVNVIVRDIVEKKGGEFSKKKKEKKGGAIASAKSRLAQQAHRLALEARNSKGDTPLHCAASAGNANIISCLFDLLANNKYLPVLEFLRMQNQCGETALHQAVRAANHNKEACIDQLMAVDPELACIPHEDGASPLYLAISTGETEIARHLYVKSEGKLSYSGPDGRNVLHAAVSRGQGLPTILKWLKDVKTMSSGSSVATAPDLLSQLTSQRDRLQKGSTPLHLAASLDWSLTHTELLLVANESTAYQADNRGSYPIHVAARSGRLDVVELLLRTCPDDCATLRDGKGRTFLHVAVKHERRKVVRYVVWGGMPQHLSKMILNAQDSNGETALHVAVRAGNFEVFDCLFRNRQVRLDVENQDGMTPFDLSDTTMPGGFYYKFNPRNIVRMALHAAGAPRGGGHEKHMLKRDLLLDKESNKLSREATQVIGIVSALIATVTFASAFTLPGGYRSADDPAGAAGTPVLAGSYAFDAFILADSLAFICSIAATFFLVYVGPSAMDISIRFRYFRLSGLLVRSAARSLVAAFGLGLYLVVHHTASAIAACAIVFASSIFGNIEVWQVIRMARTVRARIGIRRYAVLSYVREIFLIVLINFWSYLIIFSLPAIRKRVH